MKDIETKNEIGQWHGYQEWYWCGKPWIISNFKNGIRDGFNIKFIVGRKIMDKLSFNIL